MRRLLFALLVASCAPAVHNPSGPLDEDLEMKAANTASPDSPSSPPPSAPPAAPHASGLRTGVISRAGLLAVLDAGPGLFLRQVEVAPRLHDDTFVGWQVIQILDHSGPVGAADIAPGDILLAVNNRPLTRPDDLQSTWDQLRTSPTLTADLLRGTTKFSLHFDIH